MNDFEYYVPSFWVGKMATLKQLHSRCEAQPNGCILYPQTKHRYGIVVTIHGRMTAHRAAWTFVNGPIPKGKQIMHICDTPRCCNPAHLSMGTALDNMRDKISKGRSGKYRPRVSDEIVLEMHRLRASGKKVREIAAFAGITDVAAQYILSGKRHANLKLLARCA